MAENKTLSIYEYNDGIAFILNDNVEDELAFYSRYTNMLSCYDSGIFVTEIGYDTLVYITNEIIKYKERIDNELDKNE